MRWRRLGRRLSDRVAVTFTERDRRPSKDRWLIIRDRDGRVWAGPYRWKGETFTKSQRYWYLFANVESAQAAVTGHGFVGVTVWKIV